VRRLLRSPVTQFLIVGLLTVTAIVIATNFLAARAASDEAVAEARRTTQLLARSVAQPDVPKGLVEARTGAIDKFDRRVLKRLLVGEVAHVDIMSSDGEILYSDRRELLHSVVELDEGQLRVLAKGGTTTAVAEPGAASQAAGQFSGDAADQVEIFSRMRAPEGKPLLFGAYYELNRLDDRQAEIVSAFRWITIGPFLLLIALVTLMLSILTGQLTNAGKERERLLRSAIDASDAERRRIARDLHDGVVQDLAGTAFSIGAIARDSGTPDETRATLQGAGSSLRDSLKALRSLVAEIHPPELHSEGLPAALADLIAGAGPAGIQASVSVEGAETASNDMAALVWRVAQEAVRNAIRHSGASTLAVTVRGDGRRLTLEVVDDGVGFEPGGARHPHSYGLRGLKTLVADCGGELGVRSSPGEGTTVHMEVDAR
jgi:two-component system NarL family sensor kinase